MPTPVPSHSRRTVARMLTVATIGVIVGLAVRGCAGPTPTHVVSVRPPSRRTEPTGPTGTRAGVPVGFARTTDGAIAAAVAYVLTGQRLVNLSPLDAADAVRVMAAQAASQRQVDDVTGRLGALRDALARGAGPIQYWQSVLATRVDASSPTRVRVLVWSVGVLARAGVAAPQAGWTTSVFELVWEHADWKIWSETTTSGPTPILNDGAPPATDREFATALTGFTPWQATA